MPPWQQRWYLKEGIPLGHGVREACSTFSICGAKDLAFRQLHLDLDSHLSHSKYSGYDTGTERDQLKAVSECKLCQQIGMYQKLEHINFKTMVETVLPKQTKYELFKYLLHNLLKKKRDLLGEIFKRESKLKFTFLL